MSDKIIDKAVARLEREAIFPYRSLRPVLIVIHKTDMDNGEESYLTTLKSTGEKYGAVVNDCLADTPMEVAQFIGTFSSQPMIHGIIIISDYGNMNRVLYNMIPTRLDIDSLSAQSLGNLIDNISPIAYRNAPCTAVACMKIMEEINKQENNKDSFDGQNCLIIGRSIRVGRPLAEILTQKNMTVTLAHSRTSEYTLSSYRNYDYVVSAIGKPNYWNDKHKFYVPTYGDFYVIDVGMNVDENGKLCGDVDRQWYESVNDRGYITPVKGGVGKVTTTVLFSKLFNSAAEFFKDSAGFFQEPHQMVVPQSESQPQTNSAIAINPYPGLAIEDSRS